MQRRAQVGIIVGLTIAVAVLGVRLYQSSERLDKAEQYMMSSLVAWAGACSTIALGLPHPDRTQKAADFLRTHCISEQDWKPIEALLAKGDGRGAMERTTISIFEHRLPRILARGSYDRTSFPFGYH